MISSLNVCLSQFAETHRAHSEVSEKEERTFSGGTLSECLKLLKNVCESELNIDRLPPSYLLSIHPSGNDITNRGYNQVKF